MRFALAVLVPAIAQLGIYLRVAGSTGERSFLVLAYLMLAAIGAGWFAVRRSALAGALSVALGAALYAVVLYASTGGAPLLDLVVNALGVVVSFWPYVVLGAIAAALGGALRARVIR